MINNKDVSLIEWSELSLNYNNVEGFKIEWYDMINDKFISIQRIMRYWWWLDLI